jgi:hypothetical protein
MLGYICEGLACSPSPPDVDMGSLRAAVSELAWQGMTTGDVHLLHCVQRTCASYGFDTDGSLTIQRWGEELLANTALTTQAMEGLKSEGHQDLASRLSLLSTTQVTLMHRSPRFSEFMGAIMAAASRISGQQDEGGSGSA